MRRRAEEVYAPPPLAAPPPPPAALPTNSASPSEPSRTPTRRLPNPTAVAGYPVRFFCRPFPDPCGSSIRKEVSESGAQTDLKDAAYKERLLLLLLFLLCSVCQCRLCLSARLGSPCFSSRRSIGPSPAPLPDARR